MYIGSYGPEYHTVRLVLPGHFDEGVLDTYFGGQG